MMMLGAGIELFSSKVPRSMVGKTLEQCAIGATCGLNVIAVQQEGSIVPNPPASLPLPADGELLMLGEHDQRVEFSKRFT
jgi:Trk K+ transport system NAD-binding subunit